MEKGTVLFGFCGQSGETPLRTQDFTAKFQFLTSWDVFLTNSRFYVENKSFLFSIKSLDFFH